MPQNRPRVIVGETPAGISKVIQTDDDGNIAAVDQGGVPTNYTADTSYSSRGLLNLGQLNKIRMRPAILNEHVEPSREILGTVASGTIVGQIFKASTDNINGILTTLESAESETVIDDIEEADNGALQTAWPKTGTNEVVLETTIISPDHSSTKSMKVNMNTLNDKWTFTKPATSWNMVGGTIEIDYYQTSNSIDATMTLSINDNSNTSVITLAVQDADENSWKHLSIPVDIMVGTADASAVTNIFFQVTKKRALHFAYVDNVRLRPDPGSVSIKLWDCGTTLPIGDGASFDLATDATQYTEIGDRGIGGTVAAEFSLSLGGGKRLYHIEGFVAGAAKEIPANTLLTVGNYYALTFNYVDTDVSVHGADTTYSISYYTNGYAFSTTAENVDITKINGASGSGAYSDIMFGILSTQDAYISEVQVRFLDSSGVAVASDISTSTAILLEDDNMSIVSWAERHAAGVGFDLSFGRPIFLADGGKSEAYINLSLDDSAFSVVMVTEYFFVPPLVNG